MRMLQSTHGRNNCNCGSAMVTRDHKYPMADHATVSDLFDTWILYDDSEIINNRDFDLAGN